MPFCHLTLQAEKPPPEGYPAEIDTLGNHLRARRLELDLTQAELGQRLSVHRQTVRNWELGNTVPSVRHLPAILDFLGSFTLPEAETADNFPARFTLARRALGLTQAELAEKMGVDESTVSGWERGEHRPIRRHRERVDELFCILRGGVAALLDWGADPHRVELEDLFGNY